MRLVVATPVIAVLCSFVVSCGDRPVATSSDDAALFTELTVDQPPERISSPPLEYPRQLAEASIEGMVIVAATVGVDGKIEDGSVKIVSSTNDGFEKPAIRLLMGSRFRPGMLKGAPVPTQIQLPIQFTLVR
ncbi:MAG: energy transducer TonB [Gemmatimonadales bacterium]